MSRRRVRVRATAEVLQHLMYTAMPGVWYRTDRGLPADAKCVGQGYDFERNCFWFYFEHESFAETVDGEYLPEFDAFSLSATHFSSPASADDIASLNRLTAQQFKQWDAANSEPNAVVG